MQSLSMRLARSPIQMLHTPRWRVDKINPDHDLVISLNGGGVYRIGDNEFEISEGEGMLIPAYTRFQGRHNGGDSNYVGLAQHFSLELFKRGDILKSMNLKQSVRLRDWDQLKPMIELYRASGTTMATTLQQHHRFMVILLAFLQDAFVSWKDTPDGQEPQDHLSMQIMTVVARLSSDPLGTGTMVKDALADVSYNQDYFRRAFVERIGMTPQKFRESKRMEFAVHRLQMGVTVKQVSAELGYSDPYFFSRQFKRHIGHSPSHYRTRRRDVEL